MQSSHSLLEPIHVGNQIIKNRITFCSMPASLENRQPVERQALAFYEKIAQGQAGYIVFSKVRTTPFLMPEKCLKKDDEIETYINLCQRIHAYGAKIALQIYLPEYDQAQFSKDMRKADQMNQRSVLFKMTGRNEEKERLQEKSAGLQKRAGLKMKAQTQSFAVQISPVQLMAVQDDVLAQVRRAYEAGFDGIELHGGCLAGALSSKGLNQRTDQYGGVLENRMRFIIELIERIKNGFPQMMLEYKMPVLFLTDEKRGVHESEACAFAQKLEEAGVDLIQLYSPEKKNTAALKKLSGNLKKFLNIPILLSLEGCSAKTAQRLIKNHQTDLAELSHGLLADPKLPEKLENGQPIRECMQCRQGCLKSLYEGKGLRCLMNPEREIEKAEKKKSVVIVGQGIAGLEAARVAALRGHRVELFDQRCLLEQENSRNKEKSVRFLNYYRQIFRYLDVQIHTKTKLSAALINQFEAAIITAPKAGTLDEIEGLERADVMDVRELQQLDPKFSGPIAIVGNDAEAAACALSLSKRKKEVILINLDSSMPMHYEDEKALDDALIPCLKQVQILQAQPNGLWLQHTCTEETFFVPADLIVLSESKKEASIELEGLKIPYTLTQEPNSEKEWAQAIRQGYKAGYYI